MAPTVRQHGGIIDKYIGDAIMALYSQGAADAVASALSMRDTLHEYNEGRSRAGYTPLEMGIGIHSGSLMLGTIGDDQRMESTVISDAVNTASRIEGLTKVFGVPIIISETVLAELDGRRDDIKLRYLGRLPVRGRSQGLGMYELVHAKDPLCEPKLRLRGRFEDCVRAWETDRAQADRLFADYRELFPTDPALGFFMGAARV
jgi:adenylate cyclase